MGFLGVRSIDGGEILLVPLPGHTAGHAGVAVRTAAGWTLHAGDAYISQHELDPVPSCPVGNRVFERLIAAVPTSRRRSQAGLRRLAGRDDLRIVCSHDPSCLPEATDGSARQE